MRELLHKARDVWAEFSAVNASTHASSLSYYTFLSLVPLIAICISLLSVVGLGQQETAAFLVTIFPDALGELVTALVSDAFERSGPALSISTITLLWSASKCARALRTGLNAAYGKEETRGTVAVVAISVLAGLALDVLVAAAIYLVFSESVRHALTGVAPNLPKPDALEPAIDSVATMVFGVISLAACYAFLPAGRRRLVTQLPGATVAILASGVLSLGFRIYVDNFANFTMLYGSIATAALLLFWMYLVSFVIIAGGFINRLVAERGKTARPEGQATPTMADG